MRSYMSVEAGAEMLWPHHIKPCPDEILSSWMVRLAHAHGYKLEKMSLKLFGRGHGLWSSDIDRTGPDHVIQKLSEITGTPIERAQHTTIKSFAAQGQLPGEVHQGGYSPWILPLHLFHRQRTKPGLMYCPLCLRQEKTFYRRSWRLAFHTICETHQVNLLDTCPRCTGPVSIHRIDIGAAGRTPRDGALIHCSHCGFDLSRAPVSACTSEALPLSERLTGAMSEQWIEGVETGGLHAIPFFTGLRILARWSVKRIVPSRTVLEDLPVHVRRDVIAQLGQWLEDWPNRFLHHVRQEGVCYSDLAPTRQPLPFWLDKVLQTLKRHQHPQRFPDEIEAIARVVGGSSLVSTSELRKSFGVHTRYDKLPFSTTTVSEIHHARLMTCLQRKHARVKDEKDKLTILQDKVIFGLLRYSYFSAEELCRLQLSDVPTDLEAHAADFTDEGVQGRKKTVAALRHHIRVIRPLILMSKISQNVFVSPYTGQPFSPSSLQGHFKKAVVEGELAESIPSMESYKLCKSRIRHARQRRIHASSPLAKAGRRCKLKSEKTS
ncbi:MAG: TniQ family protein [Xylophilus ampelinus]